MNDIIVTVLLLNGIGKKPTKQRAVIEDKVSDPLYGAGGHC